MRVAVGADHAGWSLKQQLTEYLRGAGFDVLDLAAEAPDSGDDYPDVALQVGRAVASGQAERGVLICGTGVGMSLAANKVKGVYAALCRDTYSARMARAHNDANILTLGGRVMGLEPAKEIALVFLQTEFDGAERHRRRIAKFRALETERSPRTD